MKPSQLFIVIFLLLLVLSACSPIDAVATNDFSISASPINLTIPAGSNSDTMINTAILTGAAGAVSFSVSGLPAGITAAFNAVSVIAGGSSKLTLAVDAAVPSGVYIVTVTGTEASVNHMTTVMISVVAAVPNDFSISASPIGLSITQGGSGDTTISTAVLSGVAGNISLSASGMPAGIAAIFNVVSVAAGGSSKLTFKVASTAAPGTYHITVTGIEGAMTHIITLTVTVLHKKERPKPTPCFRGVC